MPNKRFQLTRHGVGYEQRNFGAQLKRRTLGAIRGCVADTGNNTRAYGIPTSDLLTLMHSMFSWGVGFMLGVGALFVLVAAGQGLGAFLVAVAAWLVVFAVFRLVGAGGLSHVSDEGIDLETGNLRTVTLPAEDISSVWLWHHWWYFPPYANITIICRKRCGGHRLWFAYVSDRELAREALAGRSYEFTAWPFR